MRIVLPGPHSADRTVAYVFLTLAYPKITLAGGYDQYRKVRTNILHAYCLHTLHEHRNLKRALGIGFDASPKITGRRGGSEDMLALEVSEWTPALEQQARELREKFDIMDPERMVKGVTGTDEYPSPVPAEPQKRAHQKKKAPHETAARCDQRLLRQQDREWRERQKKMQM